MYYIIEKNNFSQKIKDLVDTGCYSLSIGVSSLMVPDAVYELVVNKSASKTEYTYFNKNGDKIERNGDTSKVPDFIIKDVCRFRLLGEKIDADIICCGYDIAYLPKDTLDKNKEKFFELDKLSLFSEELELLKFSENRKLAEELIKGLPDYFFTIPASSSGKYHPSYALGEGGLVRHTKAAIKIAIELLNLEQYEELKQYKDEIVIALLLHDGFKQGNKKEGYTVNEHPFLAANYVRNANYKNKVKLGLIGSLIETHMGQWDSGVNLKPVTNLQNFVHLCDYLASRKFLEVTFN